MTNTTVENKLPKFETYDVASYVSVHDVEAMTNNQMPESKVRALLGLYCIEPIAERKTPNTRGRGLHLFNRTEVEKALNHFFGYFKNT